MICHECRMIKFDNPDQYFKPEYALKKKLISQEDFDHLEIDNEGYLKSNPDCKKCQGKGFKDVKIVFGENSEKTYIGICPICSQENGVAFQYEYYDPIKDCMMPTCINKTCANFGQQIQWIEQENVDGF